MADRLSKVVYPKVIGHSCHFLLNKFFVQSIPSIRSVDVVKSLVKKQTYVQPYCQAQLPLQLQLQLELSLALIYSEEISNPKKFVFGGISTSLKEGLESSTCLAKMKFIGSETLL